MKQNKIVVLGIDALEYDLVEEWGLKYLKQKAYCKTDLSDFSVIITPLIWGAMITGRKNKEIEDIYLKRARFYSNHGTTLQKEQKQYMLAKIGSKILPDKIKNIMSKKILPDPFKETYDIISRRNYTTLFDFFDKTWNNGIPSYGRNVSNEEVKRLMEIAVNGNPQELLKYSMNLYRKERGELLLALEGNYDLIFWYTPFLDEIEHFYITKKVRLLNIYIELNKFVKNIKENLEEDDLLYIISDHGMKIVKGSRRGGDHSDHGFFSSNTGELIQKPQDLFYLVKKKATQPDG